MISKFRSLTVIASAALLAVMIGCTESGSSLTVNDGDVITTYAVTGMT